MEAAERRELVAADSVDRAAAVAVVHLAGAHDCSAERRLERLQRSKETVDRAA